MSNQIEKGSLRFGRRTFLKGASGLALGLVAGACSKIDLDSAGSNKQTAIGAFIEIGGDGHVTVTTPGAEMGQGVSSSLPKIVVEELGADWETVMVRLSVVDAAFNSPRGQQRSANSDAITSYFEPLRKVGASAREMLSTAAAARWNVDVSQVSIENGVISRIGTDDRFTFGDVVEEAAQLPVPTNPRLKDPKDFQLIGKATQRKDIPAKVFGTSVFGIDIQLPGMLYAAIKHVPVAGGSFNGFDESEAKKMPGVQAVVPLDNAVAVVADSYWQAQQAVDTISFDDVQGELLNSDELMEGFARSLSDDSKALPFFVGGSFRNPKPSAELADVEQALTRGDLTFEQQYSVPYLAHMAMEPLCATAKVESGSCEIWAPTQAGNRIPPEVAAATDIPESAMTIHRTYMGGGFGRKNERDFIIQAVQIAKAMAGQPVKLIWSREQDTKNDFYRPAAVVRTRAAVKSDGSIVAAHSRMAGQILSAKSPFRREGMAAPAILGDLLQPSYEMDTARIDMVESSVPIRTGYWRSVARSSNGFFSEMLINDLAVKLKRDPLEYRLALLGDNPRAKAVLELAAEKANWRQPKGENTGRGIAFTKGWNSPCAQVVEVTVQDRQLKIERVTCSFDCGLQVDPDNIVAQIEGGITFGLSAALFGKIHFEQGSVIEKTFAEYRMMTLANMPPVDVHLLQTADEIGGVGEAGVPAVAPALCAAIQDACGVHVPDLPVEAAGFTVTS